MSFSFKEWYEVNGDRLNAKRKSRYHTDTEYRKRVLETNQQSREKRKGGSNGSARKQRVRKEASHYKTVDVEINGVTEKMFTIGALAETLGCSIQAIRIWERQGLIPEATTR